MKANYKSRFIMAAVLMVGGIMQAGAQTKYKTDVSISEQLINGTVPGLQYGPKKVQPLQQSVVLNKSANNQGLDEQIKNGTFGGLPVATGGGGARKFKANAQSAKIAGAKKPMASEVQTEAKQVPVTTPALPTQGKEPATEKIKITKTPELPTQGENASPATKEPVKNNN